MDENELVKVGIEVALRPITDIAENALGVLGGDWLSEIRRRNRERLKANTDALLRKRGVRPEEIPSPSLAMPLLSGAQDESSAELQDIWARLLAAILDPKKSRGFRKEFLEVARQMEPLDALVLPMLEPAERMEPTRAVAIAKQLGIPTDQVLNAFGFFHRVGLTEELPTPQIYPQLTSPGRQFLAAIRD
jgi:hypothetical protein